MLFTSLLPLFLFLIPLFSFPIWLLNHFISFSFGWLHVGSMFQFQSFDPLTHIVMLLFYTFFHYYLIIDPTNKTIYLTKYSIHILLFLFFSFFFFFLSPPSNYLSISISSYCVFSTSHQFPIHPSVLFDTSICTIFPRSIQPFFPHINSVYAVAHN